MSDGISSTAGPGPGAAAAAGRTAGTGARPANVPSRGALWFAFVGAPIAWALNLVLGYSVQAAACNSGRWGAVLGVPSGRAIPVLLSIVAACVGVAAVVVAYRCWRITGTGEENPEATVPAAVGRSWFMSYAGLASSLLFLLAIILTAVVELSLRPC